MSQKASDRSTIPLCANCHRTGRWSYHKLGPAKFQEQHRIDIRRIVERLNRKPRLTIEDGIFIAHVDGEEYPLPHADALPKAVRSALAICRETRIASDRAS